MGALILVLSFAVFFAGRDLLHLPLPQLQTLIFVMLVFTGQGTVYLVRERRHFWQSRPGKWLILSSVADLCVVSILAIWGILMAPLAPGVIAAVLLACVVYLTGLDFLKISILEHFSLHIDSVSLRVCSRPRDSFAKLSGRLLALFRALGVWRGTHGQHRLGALA